MTDALQKKKISNKILLIEISSTFLMVVIEKELCVYKQKKKISKTFELMLSIP